MFKIAVIISVSATILLLLLQGCSASDVVKEKEREWTVKIEQFQPLGKTRSDLFNWQKENNVLLNSFPHEDGIILETIDGDGLVCSRWHIMLAIDIGPNEKISTYSVSSVGTCL